jgi:hypothetical protein
VDLDKKPAPKVLQESYLVVVGGTVDTDRMLVVGTILEAEPVVILVRVVALHKLDLVVVPQAVVDGQLPIRQIPGVVE